MSPLASRAAQIIAVGGGKGGVGKSSVAVGVAIAIAQTGHTTVIVDLDLGASNLHTLLGLKTTQCGVGDFIYNPKSRFLIDYAMETGVANLKLISGNGFIPGIANLEHARKIRLLKALLKLNAEYVVLDLGAGTSYNVVDFFSITNSGIVVTQQEPTAVLNAYEFLKNVLYRIFSQRFKKKPEVAKFIDAFKISGGMGSVNQFEALVDGVGAIDAAARADMLSICEAFCPALILNMARGDSEVLGKSLRDICKMYLNVSVGYLGAVPYDDCVHKSITALRPFMIEYPDSPPSQAIVDIARKCMDQSWLSAIQSQRLEEEEETEEGAAPASAPSTALSQATGMSTIFKGHAESELSSLIGTFLFASQGRVEARESAAAGPVARAEEPGPIAAAMKQPIPAEEPGPIAAAMEQPPVSLETLETVDLKLVPRIDARMKQPMFVAMDKRLKTKKMLFLDCFGVFSRNRKSKAAVTSAVSQILKIPQATNVAIAMKSLMARAPRAPETGEAWMQTGLALLERDGLSLDFIHSAFACAQACLPTDPAVANNRAASLMAIGMMEPANDVLASALKRSPAHPGLNFNIGLVHTTAKRYTDAIACFDVTSKMQGQRGRTAAFLSGYCRHLARDFKTAAAVFSRLEEADHQDLPVLFNGALSCLYDGQSDKAVSLFTSVLALSPEDAEALAGRGLAYWRNGKMQEAVAGLTRAIRIDPANLSFRITRGAMARELGEFDLAIADIQIITQLSPGHTEFQQLLAQIRSKINV